MAIALKITRFPYEEPYHVHLLLEASNGSHYASIEYYERVDALLALGRELIQFPFTETREHIYQVGSEDPSRRCAYYIRLRFFLINARGSSGIEVHFNNNRPEAPYRAAATFTIAAEVASINRLGKLLTEFGQLCHLRLEWHGNEGELLQSAEG